MLSQDGTGFWSVAWVADLHGIETVIAQSPEGTPRAPILYVSGRDQAADSVDQIGNVPKLRQVLRDKCRLASAEIPIEGVLHIPNGTAVHQCLSHVRPPDGPATCRLENVLKFDLYSEAMEPRDHSARPTIAVVAAFGQKSLDLIRCGRQKIP